MGTIAEWVPETVYYGGVSQLTPFIRARANMRPDTYLDLEHRFYTPERQLVARVAELVEDAMYIEED